MSRICEEFPRRGNYEQTLSRAITTTGHAIFFTASALVIGMAPWYFLSSLRFQANMGILIAALMVINMIAALVVIPLLVSIVKPKFVSRRTITGEKIETVSTKSETKDQVATLP
jgi:predicted RND superfamily exporter protein